MLNHNPPSKNYEQSTLDYNSSKNPTTSFTDEPPTNTFALDVVKETSTQHDKLFLHAFDLVYGLGFLEEQ